MSIEFDAVLWAAAVAIAVVFAPDLVEMAAGMLGPKGLGQ